MNKRDLQDVERAAAEIPPRAIVGLMAAILHAAEVIVYRGAGQPPDPWEAVERARRLWTYTEHACTQKGER